MVSQQVKGGIVAAVMLFSAIATSLLYFMPASAADESTGTAPVTDWLYATTVNQTQYQFRATGVGHILVDITGTDFTSFTLDGKAYEASFGFNSYALTFPCPCEVPVHNLTIDAGQLPFFKDISVEPVFLYVGNVNTTLNQFTNITFYAGGPISILTRPDFYYNWLYLQLDDVVIKQTYDPATYPAVDSAAFAALVEGGTYIRNDINVAPGSHTLLIGGNGSLEVKIVVNQAFANDSLTTPEKVMLEGINDLDPLVPATWGFFEKSAGATLIPYNVTTPALLVGRFTFFIPSQTSCPVCGEPATQTPQYLYIDVYDGAFSRFALDGDTTLLVGVALSANCPDTQPASQFVASVAPGWHSIDYLYDANPASIISNISFRINTTPIQVVKLPELQDTSGSGVKDAAKYSSGLNTYSPDSDGDGLPDNLDPSPLSSLTLDTGKITQIVMPTNSATNTLFSCFVQKPNPDYSTGSGSLTYLGQLANLKVVLVLRLFGSSTITRQQLSDTWGKPVQTYNLVPGYDAAGTGGDLPMNGPGGEYAYILPSLANNSFEYDFTYPKGCEAKNDSLLDLRFDFVWLVLNGSAVLHIYDPEAPILVQALATRDIGDVNYLLGSPTCMVDSQALWALVQNPTLGSPSDYGLSSEVVGGGGVRTVDYFSLASNVTQLRASNPRGSRDSEVLYVSALETNLDVLNKIALLNEPNPSFGVLHEGDYQALYSYYSVSDVYGGLYKAGDPALQGEQKTVYETYWNNGTAGVVQDASILGIAINMNIATFPNSKVLTLTQAIGCNILYSSISNSLATLLDEHIQLEHQTFIEPNGAPANGGGIPVINYNDAADIYKEAIDNGPENVNWNTLFFQPFSNEQSEPVTSQSIRPIIALIPLEEVTPATGFADLVESWLSALGTASYQADFISKWANDAGLTSIRDSMASAREDISGLLKMVYGPEGEIGQGPISFESRAESIHWFTDDLKISLPDALSETYKFYIESGSNFEPILEEATNLKNFDATFNMQSDNLLTKFTEKATEEINCRLCSCPNGVGNNFDNARIYAQIEGVATGAISIAMGAFMLYAGIAQLIQLFGEQNSGTTADFALRMASAVSFTALGTLSIVYGVVTLAATLASTASDALLSAVSFLGKAVAVVGIIVTVLQIGNLVSQALSGQLSGAALTSAIAQTAITMILTTAVPFLIGLATVPLYGTVAAALITLGLLLYQAIEQNTINQENQEIQYVNSLNQPGFEVTSTNLILPTASIKRHGSLTEGDGITYQMNVKNNGTTQIWAFGDFLIGYQYFLPSQWEGDMRETAQGQWCAYGTNYWDPLYSPGYAPGATDTYSFTRVLDSNMLTIDLEPEEILRMDWNASYIAADQSIQSNRTFGMQYQQQFFTGLPVLPATIHDFCDVYCVSVPGPAPSTSQLYATGEALKQAFANAVANYQYKDAYDDANQIIANAQAQVSTPLADLALVQAGAQSSNSTFSVFQASSEDQFESLLQDHYGDGFQATVPLVPDQGTQSPDEYQLISSMSQYERNIFAYNTSLGQILVPTAWLNSTANALADIANYTQLRDQLPLQTNIAVDSTRTSIQLQPNTPTVETIYMALEGPDNPTVDFEIDPPAGFTATPTIQTLTLAGPVTFTLASDPTAIAGEFTIVMRDHADGAVLFEGLVPLHLVSETDITLVPWTGTITPGDTQTVISLENQGDTPEFVNFSETGLPDQYFASPSSQSTALNATESLLLMPGDVHLITLAPPRSYTTAPLSYPFTVTVTDAVSGVVRQSFAGTVAIAAFFDMSFQCVNSDQSGTDQQDYYTFDLSMQNLGNAPDSFFLSGRSAPGLEAWFTDQNLYLNPGEEGSSQLVLGFVGIGYRYFPINVYTGHNSSVIFASLNVTDEYPFPPAINSVEFADAIAPNTVTDEPASLLVQVNATSPMGIYSVYVQFWGTGAYATLVNGLYQVLLPSPRMPGNYSLRVTVQDADMDPGADYYYPQLDSKTTVQDVPFTIVDEPVTPPVIHSIVACPYEGQLSAELFLQSVPPSSVLIPDTANSILVFINASDSHGITYFGNSGPGGFISFVEFGGVSYQVYGLANGLLFAILPNPRTIGTYTGQVTLGDDDCDYPGDQSSTTQTFTVQVVATPPQVRVVYSNASMAGNYPGTFTFSSADATPFPQGWVIGQLDATGKLALSTKYAVVPEYTDVLGATHADVLELIKDTTVASVLAGCPVIASRPVTNGSVEFWLAVTGDPGEAGGVELQFDTGTGIAVLGLNVTGTFVVVSNGTGNGTVVGTCAPGWHHFRLDFIANSILANSTLFNVTLANGTIANVTLPGSVFNVTVDGDLLATNISLGQAASSLSSVIFLAGAPGVANPLAVQAQAYIDAIGFSWDPRYYVGEDLKPGIDITPVNNTGEYPATWTFSANDLQNFLANWHCVAWPDTTQDASAQLTPLPSYAGHQTVLAFSAPPSAVLGTQLATPQASGTVEFWANFAGDPSVTFAFGAAQLTSSTQVQPYPFFLVQNGTLWVGNPFAGVPLVAVAAVSGGAWHHFRIDYAQAGVSYLGLTGQYRVYVDQVMVGQFVMNFALPVNAIGFWDLAPSGTSILGGAATMYLDAIGVSWDPLYQVGDNLVVQGPPAPPQVTVDYGSPNATLTWVPWDLNDLNPQYTLYQNGTIMVNGTWAPGTPVTWNLAGLLPGDYLFKITFSDGLGLATASAVLVHVTASAASLLALLDEGVALVKNSPDSAWLRPASCYKEAMLDMLADVGEMIADGNFAGAYNLLARDILPKLNGTTNGGDRDHNGCDCDHSNWDSDYAQVWVTSATLRQQFSAWGSELLAGIHAAEVAKVEALFNQVTGQLNDFLAAAGGINSNHWRDVIARDGSQALADLVASAEAYKAGHVDRAGELVEQAREEACDLSHALRSAEQAAHNHAPLWGEMCAQLDAARHSLSTLHALLEREESGCSAE